MFAVMIDRCFRWVFILCGVGAARSSLWHHVKLLIVVMACQAYFFIEIAVADDAIPSEPYEISFETDNREWGVFACDGLERKERLALGDQVLRLIKHGKPKSVIHVFGASPVHYHVLTVEIPDTQPELRLRSKEMKKVLAKLKKFVTSFKPNASKQLEIVRVGASFEKVRRTNLPCCVVLAGSPIYVNKLHQGLSMAGGLVPTDSTLIKSELSHLSPFYQGVRPLPEHTLISIYSQPNWGVDQINESAVEDFWRKFFELNGNSHLQRISDSMEAAFNLVERQVVTPALATKKDEYGVNLVTMQSVQDHTEPQPLTIFLGRPRLKPPVYEIDPPKNVEEIFAKALASKTHTAIAIRWLMDKSHWTFTDVDLHLSHPDYEEKLSFSNAITPYSKLLKDVRYGTGGRDQKTDRIEFGENWEIAVVKNKYLPKLEGWLNIFSAVGGPIEVNVVQIGDGRRRDAYYSIPVRHGDEAIMINDREKSKAWFRLPLPVEAIKDEVATRSDTEKEEAKRVPKQASTPRASFKITSLIEKPTFVSSLIDEIALAINQLAELKVKLPAAVTEPATTTNTIAAKVAPVHEPTTWVSTAKTMLPQSNSAVIIRHRPHQPVVANRSSSIDLTNSTTQPVPWAWDYLCEPCK